MNYSAQCRELAIEILQCAADLKIMAEATIEAAPGDHHTFNPALDGEGCKICHCNQLIDHPVHVDVERLEYERDFPALAASGELCIGVDSMNMKTENHDAWMLAYAARSHAIASGEQSAQGMNALDIMLNAIALLETGWEPKTIW